MVYACLSKPMVRHGVLSLIAVQPEHIEAIRNCRNAQMDVLRQSAPITPDEQTAYYAANIWPVSFLLEPHLAKANDVYALYFSTFLRLIQTVAFDDLELHRLFTETYATRAHHISILESTGFHLEGTLKDHVRIQDQPVDSVIHGCVDGRGRSHRDRSHKAEG